MGMGNLRYTVTFYPQACLVHVNLAPLVVTLVHKDGQGDSEKLNFGDALDLIPELSRALEPLRIQVGYINHLYSRISLGSPTNTSPPLT